MDEYIIGNIIVVISILLGAIILLLAWYFYIKARNKERLMMIEKGLFSENNGARAIKWDRIPWKILGMTLAGFGFGILFMEFWRWSQGPRIGYWWGFPLLFGGIGMVIAQRMDRKKKNSDPENG